MATCNPINSASPAIASDALHALKQLIGRDPQFAAALRSSETTEQAAELARLHGLNVTPEALWRHRGTLVEGGRPTWRG